MSLFVPSDTTLSQHLAEQQRQPLNTITNDAAAGAGPGAIRTLTPSKHRVKTPTSLVSDMNDTRNFERLEELVQRGSQPTPTPTPESLSRKTDVASGQQPMQGTKDMWELLQWQNERIKEQTDLIRELHEQVKELKNASTASRENASVNVTNPGEVGDR